MEAHLFDDREFYQSLGKLFYAVASIDTLVAQEEIVFLKTIIQDDWQSSSLVQPDKMLQILSEFDRLLLEKADAGDCFLEFKGFLESRKYVFPLSIKNLIWKTADGIAAAYAGKNKSEVILLAKLKSALLDLPS
jgi:hypothetical protein